MYFGSIDLLAGLHFLRQRRPVCSPNEYLMSVLLQLEQELLGVVQPSLDLDVYRENRFGSADELRSPALVMVDPWEEAGVVQVTTQRCWWHCW